jgi:hypothetical protein
MSFKSVGIRAAADSLESMLDGTGGATLTLRNVVIDARSVPGTIGLEIKTDDKYPFACWDAQFHASADEGLRFSAEETADYCSP